MVARCFRGTRGWPLVVFGSTADLRLKELLACLRVIKVISQCLGVCQQHLRSLTAGTESLAQPLEQFGSVSAFFSSPITVTEASLADELGFKRAL